MISIEFVWKANSQYWAGRLAVVDLYINGEKRYSVSIPETAEAATALNLPFKQGVTILTINKPETLKTLSFKAGVFNEKPGNTMIRQSDGSFDRPSIIKREDISVSLDVRGMEDGHHYQIIFTHSMHRESAGSPFWLGDDLCAEAKEAGPCKQAKEKPQQLPSLVQSFGNMSVNNNNSSASSATYGPVRDHFTEQRAAVLAAFKNMFFSMLMMKTGELLLKTIELDEDPHNVNSPHAITLIIEQSLAEMPSTMEAKVIAELFSCCQSADEMKFLNTFLNADGENRLRTLSLNIFKKVSPGAPDRMMIPLANRIVQIVADRKGLTPQQGTALALRNLERKLDSTMN